MYAAHGQKPLKVVSKLDPAKNDVKTYVFSWPRSITIRESVLYRIDKPYQPRIVGIAQTILTTAPRCPGRGLESTIFERGVSALSI